MKLLIIQQKMIGDVLTSTILFEALRKHFPEAQLDYLVETNTLAVIENNPYIDNSIILSPNIRQNKILFWRFLNQIRSENYTIVIDVYSVTTSALTTFFSAAKQRISYRKWYTKCLYTNTVLRSKIPSFNISLARENRLKLLQPLGINPDTTLFPKIYLTEIEKNNARKLLEQFEISKTNPLYMISVLGSNNSKTYPTHFMANVLDFICETQPNAQLLFNYIPSQITEAKNIFNLCKPQTKNCIYFNLYGKTLREFLALTWCCDAMIGNEGGAINMAKALNTPTFTIFSPYIIKKNWFGAVESKIHSAVHLNDYETYDLKTAKKNSGYYYNRFKPELFLESLSEFLNKIKI